jgi:hypothetical protein
MYQTIGESTENRHIAYDVPSHGAQAGVISIFFLSNDLIQK